MDLPDDCEVLTDFKNATTNEAWRTVNDNVMGGKSKGGFVFMQDALVFSGYINTDGGGFSSIRMDLKGKSMEGFETINLRLRTKDLKRKYEIIMEDRNRSSIVYRSTIPIENTEDWQEVSMPLADFTTSRRGKRIQQPNFKKEAPRSIGFILSDTSDGTFTLEVDWIKLCR